MSKTKNEKITELSDEELEFDSSEESECSTDTEDELEDEKNDLKSIKKIERKNLLFGIFKPRFFGQNWMVLWRSISRWLFQGLKFGGNIAWFIGTAYVFLLFPLQYGIATEMLLEEQKRLYEQFQANRLNQ
jgi:hypothetical protein